MDPSQTGTTARPARWSRSRTEPSLVVISLSYVVRFASPRPPHLKPQNLLIEELGVAVKIATSRGGVRGGQTDDLGSAANAIRAVNGTPLAPTSAESW
jgi:hypothetical protein